MEKKRPSGRFQPLRAIAFKISNDLIMICRNPGATAPWDPAMDRGNLTDLTALVLADRAGFCARARVRNRSIATENRPSAFRPIATTEQTSRHVSKAPLTDVGHPRE
jgi:hypothetical protein